MKLRKYRAASIKQAFAQARAELGEDAVLLHQRKVPHPSTPGLSLVEITVAADLPGDRIAASEVRPFFVDGGEPGHQAPRLEASGDPGAKDAELLRMRAEYDRLREEMAQVRSLLLRQAQQSVGVPRPLAGWYTALREVGLAADRVQHLLMGLDEVLTPSALERPEMVEVALVQRLVADLPPARGPLQPGQPGQPRVFVIVGPTGVGKTTTIAKLAAYYGVQRHIPIALVTADTYRIGAVGQLRTYGELIRAPLDVAYTPDELAEHIRRHQDKQIIFVDTPGRSPSDTEQLEVLRSFMAVLEDPDVHIAVAAGTSAEDARNVLEHFAVVPPSGLIVTKLDETSLYGLAYTTVRESQIPLAYLTTGQRVPEDIRLAQNVELAQLVVRMARHRLAQATSRDETMPVPPGGLYPWAESQALGIGH